MAITYKKGRATSSPTLETGGYDRRGNTVSTRKASPLSQAYEQINPAKDLLDQAMMKKYPGVDFDSMKRGAEDITNDKLEDYAQSNKDYLQYSLTPEEMQGALKDSGYENYFQNAKAIRATSGLENTGGAYEEDVRPQDQRYGMRQMLYKYATPRVKGKLMPYRYFND